MTEARATEARVRITNAANIVLAGGAAVSILLLAYVVYHYLLIGDRTFSGRLGIFIYCGIPIVLASAFLLSLRQAPSTRTGLALIFLSLGCSIALGELVVYFFNPLSVSPNGTIPTPPATARDMNELVTLAQSYGVQFDTRGKLEVINDLEREGIHAVPSIVPGGLLKQQSDGVMKPVIQLGGTDILPLAGISNRYTVLCNEVGQYLSYWSDEHGFHNPQGAWSSGVTEIAAVGDSYAHGACVSSDEGFMAVVRKEYPSALNLGIAGNGPLLELATLVEYARSLRPRIVLWFFYEGNDLVNLSIEKKSPLLMRYLESGFDQGLINVQAELDTAMASYVESAREEFLDSQIREDKPITARALIATLRDIAVLSNLRRRLGLVYGSHDDPRDTPPSEEDQELLARTLIRGKEVVSDWAGTLYLVYLPSRDRYVDARIADASDGVRSRVAEIAAAAGIPVIDIARSFENHSDPLSLFPFRRLGHYNRDGHRLVAETVIQAISPDLASRGQDTQ